MDQVVLVDNEDNEVGVMDKLEAHQKGILHRAFSIFVFNHRGEMLLQKRASHKYHSGGLWTNTCCSHPRPFETLEEATHRRLVEEMGFDCKLEKSFSFIYQAELDKGLTEHELDHVFIGYFSEDPIINPEEVENWKYIRPENVKKDMELNPEKYTFWFRKALGEVLNSISV